MTNVKPLRSPAPDAPGGPVRLRLLLLALETFAVGTDGMVTAGILPLVARDLDVSISVAGQMVNAFALSYGVLAPVLATARWTRRRASPRRSPSSAPPTPLRHTPSYDALLATRSLAAVGSRPLHPHRERRGDDPGAGRGQRGGRSRW
ncbi:hypothetical protein ACRAWF_08515 [Streptomyces sp. L7]